MRRGYSYSAHREDSGGEQGFWPSYADMMSAVALILFFLMLLSYIQNLITGNDLQNTQEVLNATKAQVIAAQAEYDKAVKKDLLKKNTASRRKANLHEFAKKAGVKLAKKA